MWWHLILSTKCSWLPGDPRGFRSRKHRIHSSGDYKNPPPPDEHAKLYRYHQQRDGQPLLIPAALREVVGYALLRKLDQLNTYALAVSVGGMHAHLLAQWTDDLAAAKVLAGKLKQASSHSLRHDLPGRVWADGGKPIRIRDAAHHDEVYRYILDHRHEGAWVWSNRESKPNLSEFKPDLSESSSEGPDKPRTA